MIKRIILILFFFPALLFSEDRLINKAVARVNDSIITLYDLKKIVNPENPDVVSAEAVTERKDKLFGKAIADEIIKQQINELKITISKEEIEHAIKNVAMQNNVTIDELKKEIAQQNIDWEVYKNEVVREQLKILSLKRHITVTTIEVDEPILRSMYENQFKKSDHYTASHIILTSANSTEGEDPVFRQISDIHDKIVSGQISFEEAAANYSQDDSAKNGGQLGSFPLSQMVPEFSEKLKEMEEGEISKPFKSRFGWHVVKLDKIEKKDPPSFNEVRNGLLNHYYQQNMDKAFNSWLEKKKEESRIEIFF
jgi:peptidyl-prolyl cis-trans isomerase SurA